MNPVFTARKRAEEFNAMIENASTLATPDARLDLAQLAELASSLRTVEAPAARPAFVADLRERLMVAAETALAPAAAEQLVAPHTQPARPSARERRLAATVGGFAIVSATASMAVAAQTALPGETLYPLKRVIENVQTEVQRDADDKGNTLLVSASGRLAEVDELSRSGDDDARVIAQTLEDFTQQISEASDLLLTDFAKTGSAASIEQLRIFAAESMKQLQQLELLVPEAARGSLIAAAAVLNQIDLEALNVCPSCSDASTSATQIFTAASVGPLLKALVKATESGEFEPAEPSKRSREPRGTVDERQTPAENDGAAAPDSGPSNDVAGPPTATPDKPERGDKKDTTLDDVSASVDVDAIGELITGAGDVVEEVVNDLLGGLNKG
ncbi:MAG: DUF5667 domain-containing protein [Nocardioides sp.]